MLNTKLIKLKLPSVKEAKNRAIVLALLTCNYRKSSNSFVRFFTQKDFEQLRSRQTYQSIRTLWFNYKLEDDDIGTYLAAQAITSAQPHSGLIRKREEPFSSLIRARPREKKFGHDRLIVLGDADPKHVEERLGSALISNEVFDKLKDQAKLNEL